MSNLTTYKFLFTAQLNQFNLNAKVSCPIHCTWKRSGESAVSSDIVMTDGKADFQAQKLEINVNMYFDKNANSFQEKKSSFTFTMKTPKGQKMAGIVYIDLSKMLNNKIDQYKDVFPLQKCPVAGATAAIQLTSVCKGQKSGDTMSQASISMIGNQSIVSIPSESGPETKEQKKEEDPKDPKDKQIKRLKQMVDSLTKEKNSLKKQLQAAKKSMKGEPNKEQILKSKALQERLEDEVNSLKKKNASHQEELEIMRTKMEQVYNNLHKNLSEHLL